MEDRVRLFRDGVAGRALRRQLRSHSWLRAVSALAIGLAAGMWPGVGLAASRPPWDPGPPWAPLHPRSPEMNNISDLFWAMLFLSAIIFIGVTAVVLYSIFNFSEKRGEKDDSPPPQVYGNRWVELSWTAVPFVILVVAFGFTAHYIHTINTPPKGSGPRTLNIIAKGHQWWWEFYYPGQRVITANEVHVPVNTPLHFHIESADVIHSFWAPQLQRQIDANPGQDNAVYVEMTHPGIYGGACYEYCGTAHAWMKFEVVVQSRPQFNAWVKHMLSPAIKPTGMAVVGQKVFLSHTCVNCHAINYPGSTAAGGIAPNLTHLASRWTVGAGAAPMTQQAIMQWVRNPNTYKPGVLMPPYPLISQRDLRALAAYLISLK